ncbi:hypothetical protein ACHAWF_008243 [Thalassiosira exigua]
MVFYNMTLIDWLSERQVTSEESVFGAEFAVNHGIKTKFRMMGVPISGPAYIYGDNMSVINNTSKPESILRRNQISFATLQCGSLLQVVKV